MWYKIDFTKLAVQLLPPVLRSRFLAALLGVMITPLRSVYGRFCTLKGNVGNHLDTTGNVQYLEKALNDAFYLKDRQIYIETPEGEAPPSFFFARELQKASCIYMCSEEKDFVLMNKGEVHVLLNFIVMVPTFLCTSVSSKESDRFHWRYYTMIRNIVKTYKPAGRTFSIELYDYE